MQIKETGLNGLIEIIPAMYKDDRGWLYESFNARTFEKLGIRTEWVQENQSYSKKGVIRGMHLQLPPYSQAKLVTVLHGRALDVAVDVRKGSPTFGRVYSTVLDSETRKFLLIPEGFAHGFAALEDTLFYYKCSNFYHRESESGILWNDPYLNIQWPFKNPIVSEKDSRLPTWEQLLKKMYETTGEKVPEE